MYKVKDIIKVKNEAHQSGDSVNRVAKRCKVSWETAYKAIHATAEDLEQRKHPTRQRDATVATKEVFQQVNDVIVEIEGEKCKPKQKMTANVILAEMKNRFNYSGSERTMREIVRIVRKELNKAQAATFIPLYFSKGTTIQVDHGEVTVNIGGIEGTFYLFVASIPGEAVRFCQAYPTKSKEAWGLFHEEMFTFFGGVFQKVIYDNDSVLVKEVLGRDRDLTAFALELQQHYGFSAIFCNRASGHEKGAVENAVGTCRRNYLYGTPVFQDYKTLNEFLHTACEKSINDGKHYRSGESLKDIKERVINHLLPLPVARLWLIQEECKVDKTQLIKFKNHRYSVPQKWVGSRVLIDADVAQVRISYQGEILAIHPRQYPAGSDSLFLDHYLEALSDKPRALWNSQAVCKTELHKSVLRFFDQQVDKGDSLIEANKKLIELLLLSRKFSAEEMECAIDLAFQYKAVNVGSIENIAHQLSLSSRTGAQEFTPESNKYPVHLLTAEHFNIEQYSFLSTGGACAS